MNVAGARQAVRTRLLPLCVILLICLTNPAGLTAQTTADRESVNGVMESLFASAGELWDKVASLPGAWSVAIARFAKGDAWEILIPARVGQEFGVYGASESSGMDVDICVYGPRGDPVACDTSEGNFPIVIFTAKAEEGTYRAVMTAASVEGGETSYAGMVMLQVLDEGAGDAGGGR